MDNLKTLLLYSIVIITGSIFQSCSKDSTNQPLVPSSDSAQFIASISQVWIDTVSNTRKVTLANVIGTSQIIGTDEFFGDKGAINLQGNLQNFSIRYTVIIKYQPPNYPNWYIDYSGTLTDTTSGHKRMVVYSSIDTLYLKPN